MSTTKKTILVVDDEPDLVEILCDRLGLEGYTTEMAGSGNQALKLMSAKKFDLVISDVRMRDGTGPEMFKKMLELGMTTPVIFITAFSEVEHDEIMSKAVAVLGKPFDFNELKTLIDGI